MSNLHIRDFEPLNDDDILHAASEELRWLKGENSSELQENWEAAYAYYKSDPRGDEQKGLSKLQSTDVADAVEWILPTVIRSFTETPDAVRFDPVSPDDQAQADLESDYIHHVFMKRANGFLVLYEAIKDALLLKNCVTHTYWDEEITSKPRDYSDLLDDELAQLLYPTDGTEAVIEQDEATEIPATDPETGMPLLDESGQPVTVTTHTGRIRKYTTRGVPRVEVCVPERFSVRLDHGSVDLSRARFCAYSMEKSAAQLIALGYDAEIVESIRALDYRTSRRDGRVRVAREDVEGTYGTTVNARAQAHVDSSQRMLLVTRCFMTLDVNGDGYEEYILAVLGGDDSDYVLLDWYEVDGNPFDAASPFIAPHKFYGYSIYDKLKVLQDSATKFIRMIADNLDLLNNPEKKIVPGMVNPDDVLVRRVGGVKRMDDLNAYEELPPPQVAPTAFQFLDYLEQWRSNRVGVDPNASSVTRTFPEESMNTAFERLMSAKEEVVGLIVRNFAEIWFKPMMIKLRNLIMQHQNRPETAQLGSKWIRMDPRNWDERTITTVKVGLGTGDRIKKIAALRELIGYQMTMVQGGKEGYLVTNSRLRNAQADFVRFSGLGDPDEYWIDPQRTETDLMMLQQGTGQPSLEAMEAFVARQRQQAEQQAALSSQGQQGVAGPDPQTALALEQIKAQSKAQSDELRVAVEQMKIASDQQKFQIEELRKWAELAQKATESARELALEARKAQKEVET